MVKRIILFLLTATILFSFSSKELEIIKKNDILRNYKGKILLFGEYEKKDELAYEKVNGQLFTGRTVVIDNKKVVGATAEYINGKKNGTQYDYYLNGQLKISIEFKDGKKDGIQKDYYLNGKLRVSTEMKNGERNGYQYRYIEKGNLAMKIEFKDNKIQSMEVYPAGIIQKGNKTGFNNVRFTATGEDRGIMEVYKDKLKILDSEVKIVDHHSAQLAQDGKVTHYYPNGKVMIISYKKDNKTEGLVKIYSETGDLKIETTTKNNRQDGEVTFYYSNGKVQLHCDRVTDERVKGNCEIYDEKGSLLQKGYFDNVTLDTLRKEKTGEINSTKEMIKILNRYM